MRSLDERDLRTVLHEESERHHPDRQAMLDRISRARTAPAPRALARIAAVLPRPVAAAGAVASVLVLAVAGVQVANRSTQPARPAAATASPSASPSPTAAPPPARTSAPATPSSGRSGAGRTSTSLGPAAAVTLSTASPAVSDGYLGATAVVDPHSNPGWTQSNLTLTTTATLTALTVVVRIDRTAGVADVGHWSSVPNDAMTSTVDTQNTVVVYRFTLNTGATLAPGSYLFAVQFDHAAGTRAPTGDTFAATTYAARASSSASATAVPPTGSARKAQVTGVYTD